MRKQDQNKSRKRSTGAPDGDAVRQRLKRAAQASDFANAATIVDRVDLTERSAAAARKPDLPTTVPPKTKVRLVLPQAQRQDRPPLTRRRKPGSATAPSNAASQGTPDGESKDQIDHACAAAGPASQEEQKFTIPIPPPPEVTAIPRLLSPPVASTEAAAAGPAYDNSNRFPRSKRDRERQDDENQKREDRDDERNKPPEVELVRGKFYKHRLLGKVEYLNRKRGCYGEMMCSVKTEGTYIYETHLVHRRDLEPLMRPPQMRRATDVAAAEANNTTFLRPMRLTPQVDTKMSSINCSIERETRYVREYDIDMVQGKVLQATANYNLADDK